MKIFACGADRPRSREKLGILDISIAKFEPCKIEKEYFYLIAPTEGGPLQSPLATHNPRIEIFGKNKYKSKFLAQN